MRRVFFVVFAVVLTAPASAQKSYKDLEYPPLRELVIPRVEPVILPNGLALYLLEDHSLPKIDGTLLLRTGSRLEPADKVGLASLLGQVLRTGGSETRTGEEIDRLLENAGAEVETDIGETSARASVFALPEHLPLVIEILADILRRPALPEDKIELAKVQERTSIARQNDNVAAIAGREFEKLLLGAESPYARTATYATIAAITREDLTAFHRKYFVPNRTLLGLWGDFDSAEVRTLVERHFGSWERGPESADEIPAVDSRKGATIAFIEKDDVNQTNLRIGHLGGRVDDPDYFALSVMSEILGGGFSSRLFRTVRAQRGLAYGVRASWNATFDHPWSFVVASSTKSESTVETIRAIEEEIDRIANEPVTDDELRQAKDGILNSFVFNFDRKGEIVVRMMTYDYYRYPRDFLDRYQSSVERVTADDVLRVARAHLHPKELLVLAVGRQEDFDSPLSSLGEVQNIDISIPALPAEEAPEASPESLARGEEVLARFVSSVANGGQPLTGFSMEGESVLTTPQGKLPARFRVSFVGPDRYRESTQLPFGEITTVLTGDDAWASTPRGLQTLDADQKRRTHEGLYRHYLGLLWAVANGRARGSLVDANDGGAEVHLEVDGITMRATFDDASGRLLSLTLPGTNLQGAPVEETRKFSGFGAAGYPTEIEILHDGAPAAETHVGATTLNPSIDESLFARPENPEK
jgi:zinc protease